MTTPNQQPDHQPPANDPLLRRYQEANAHDDARPNPALRDRVLAHARTLAEEQASPDTSKRPPAANDSAWKLRALGSLAVMGLVGLLVLQFDRGTPEEQGVALSPVTPPSVSTESKDELAANPVRGAFPAAADTLPDLPSPAAPQPDANAAKRSAAPQAAPAMEPKPLQQPQAEAARSRMSTKPVPTEIAEAKTDDQTSAASQPEPEPRLEASGTPAMNQVPPLPSAAQATPASRTAERDPLMKERSASLAQKPVSSAALHDATKAADAGAIRRALAQGLSVDSPDSEGRTALMLAAQGSSKAVVEQLLQAGASRRLRDRQGLNAADHARLSGHQTWLELLQP